MHSANGSEGNTRGFWGDLHSPDSPLRRVWRGVSAFSFVGCFVQLMFIANDAQSKRSEARYYRSSAACDELCRAAARGNVFNLKRLREKGVRMDQPCGIISLSPLHMAVDNGHAETVDYLLRGGAAPNPTSWDGKTPLFLAERNLKARPLFADAQNVRYVRIVRLLKDAGGVSRKENNPQ